MELSPATDGRCETSRRPTRKGSGQQVAVVDRNLVGTVLIRPAIEKRDILATLHDHLVAQLAGESESRTKVAEVGIGPRVPRTPGAVVELGGGPGNVPPPGKVPG